MAEEAGLWLVPADSAQSAALRRMHKKGELLLPFPGCFARIEPYRSMKFRQRAYVTVRTLATVHRTWVFCLFSAALVHGLWVSNNLLNNVHVMNSGEYGRAGGSVVRHKAKLERQDIVASDGILATSLERTLLDCLCRASFCHALPIIDSALHWGLVDKDQMRRYFELHGKGARGVVQARKTLEFADSRSGSALESFARATMAELGFYAPELQVELFDPLEPDNPKYGDFGWRLATSRPIIGEADGMGKYTAAAETVTQAVRSMSQERRREAHLNLTEAKIVRFSYADVANREYFSRLLTAAGVPREDERW